VFDSSLVSYGSYGTYRFAATRGSTGSPSLYTSVGRLAVSPVLENRTVGLGRVVATTTLPSRPLGRGITPSVSVVTVRVLFAVFTSYVAHVPNILLHGTGVLKS
jgi:hypothetical protein